MFNSYGGPMTETHERIGDMHPNRTLKITLQRDGDVVISITQDGSIIEEREPGCVDHRLAMVEFCASSGKSHRVRAAAMALMVAIQLENEQNPRRPTR